MLTLKAFVSSAFLSSEVLGTLHCPLSKLLKGLDGVGWHNSGWVCLALRRKRTSHANSTCPYVGIISSTLMVPEGKGRAFTHFALPHNVSDVGF